MSLEAEQMLLSLQDRFSSVRKKIATAQAQSPYKQAVSLVAATKTVSAEVINLAHRHCQLTDIGENRVQELLSKYDSLDRTLRVHFIGTLQTNKVKYIIDKVDMIHSLDSVKLAYEIHRQAKKIGRVMPVLVEVNSANEASKSGLMAQDLPDFFSQISSFDGICVQGLMTLGKKTEKTEEKCEFFTKTYQLFLDGVQKKLYNVDDPILSMGMSDSFCEAIACGSNLVRVGTALFGARNTPFVKEG